MNQLFTFLVDWSLKSAVTVAFGFVIVQLLRNRSAASRNLIWRITLAAVVLLPIAMALAPKDGTPAVMEPIQSPVRAAILPIDPPRPLHAIRNQAYAALVASAEREGTPGTQTACELYALGLFWMLAVWMIGCAKVMRIARTSSPKSGVSSRHHVLQATEPDLYVPITFGLAKPLVVLPRLAEQWPEERVRAAILHESAHIARKDWAWQTASTLIRAAQWFNPAIWLLNAELKTTSEEAADDEVLTQSAMASTVYAEELLNVAASAGRTLTAATAMARRGGVAARLKRIVASGIDRGRPGRRFAFAVGLFFAAGAFLVAAGTVAEAAGGADPRQNSPTPHLSLADSVLSAIAAPSIHDKDGSGEVKLPHGGLVRIVAMSGPDNGRGPLWGPDGALAGKDDRALLQPILDRAPQEPSKDGRIINFYLQVSKLPMKRGETENGIFRIKNPAAGWQYHEGSNASTDDGRLQWDQWTAPANARSCDMDCAISYGPYKLAGRGTIGDGQFNAKIGDLSGETTSVSLSIPGKFGDCQAKLECFDHEGRLIPGGGELLWGNPDGQSEKFEFQYRSSDAKKIETFEFSTRGYQHVLIRGITLPPNQTRP